MSRQLTIKMEVKAVDDVEREKRETKEGEGGGGGGGGGCNRRHVDAAAGCASPETVEKSPKRREKSPNSRKKCETRSSGAVHTASLPGYCTL